MKARHRGLTVPQIFATTQPFLETLIGLDLAPQCSRLDGLLGRGDVALCFGWIDGVRKSYDAESFLQRYTPRRATSIWSQVNRDNVFALAFRTNNMKTPAGGARKIVELVAMLERGATIVPEREKKGR